MRDSEIAATCGGATPVRFSDISGFYCNSVPARRRERELAQAARTRVKKVATFVSRSRWRARTTAPSRP